MEPLHLWICCLAVVVGVAVAFPSAEIAAREARGQTVLDTSDPFWVFETETPDKPLVYMPSYDAILVPEPAYAPHSLPIMQNLAAIVPVQPPKRRRPILAVIDLLQKRYSQQQKKKEDKPAEGEEIVANFEASAEKSNSTSANATQDTSVCVEESVAKEDVSASEPNQTDDTNKFEVEKSENEAKAKVPQVTRIYSLLENLMKSHPNVNDGFSYAFKYSVPNSQSKLQDEVELSVQQSLKNFPEIPDDPIHGFKSPIDYKKAQAKLDLLLEDSTRTGGPVHLNTPGAFGPLLLNEYAQEQLKVKKSEASDTVESEVVETSENTEGKATKLILRPVAKAVAGPRGTAIASPIAKAVLRRGQNVELDYDPDAVAIAGPGGRAHAHPQFSVDYLDSKESLK